MMNTDKFRATLSALALDAQEHTCRVSANRTAAWQDIAARLHDVSEAVSLAMCEEEASPAQVDG